MPFILYKYVSLLPDSIGGFNEGYSALYQYIEAKHGSESARLLVHGHSIQELADVGINSDPSFELYEYIKNLYIITSAYWIGWISYRDKPQLRHLVDLELADIYASNDNSQLANQIRNQLLKSIAMLNEITESTGLCMIISG